MASLDELEGGVVEGISALILIVFIAVVLWLYFRLRAVNLSSISSGFNNFAGEFSNGLYNVGAPSMIAGPINSALSHISEWIDELVWKPGTQSNSVTSDYSETVSLGTYL